MRAYSVFSTWRYIFLLGAAFAVSSSIAQAQSLPVESNGTYRYVIISGSSVAIVGYTGSGGVVAIPSLINNMPVTTIGTGAFQNSDVTSVTIPNSVTVIGPSVFAGCARLTSVTIPGSVTSIGEGAFYQCSSLTSVTIPDSVTSIGGVTFDNCFALSSVTIGNGVTTIGNGAFANTALTTVAIPSSVTSIGDEAFGFCFVLVGITIPSNVTSIGDEVFEDCISLTAITVDPNNPDYISVAGVLFNQNQTTLIEYPAGSSGSEYTIPSSVTSIVEGAFTDCSNLTSINIPSSVTSIGDMAFVTCAKLTAITVDPNNSAYVSIAGVLFNEEQTTLIQYPIGSNGKGYTIPSSVTSITDSAFAGCSNLTNISIPNSVASIGATSFQDCLNLTTVTFPNSVTSIGGLAFSFCTNLSSAFFLGNVPPDGNCFIGSPTKVYCLLGASGIGSSTAIILNPPAIATAPSTAALVSGAKAIFSVTASANPAPIGYQWQVSADGGNTWANLTDNSTYTGSATDALTITNASAAQLGYQYQALLTNYAGTTTTTSVPLIVGTSKAQLTWLQNNFTSAQLGNPAIVGDTSEPAGDGIPNLLKYAFNLNPFVNGQSSLPQPTTSGGNLVLSFAALQSDLTYTVEASTDLVNWSTTGVTTQTNGSTVTASYPLPASGTAFLHIVVSPGP